MQVKDQRSYCKQVLFC